MWCCVSVPLVFVGAYFGYKKDSIEFPTVTSTIARAIPEPTVILNPTLGAAVAGVVPFAAAYVELFFIMTSLWMDQYYYVFGFTLLVFVILLITCAEITLLLVYSQLCAENHRWWWFSFAAALRHSAIRPFCAPPSPTNTTAMPAAIPTVPNTPTKTSAMRRPLRPTRLPLRGGIVGGQEEAGK